MIIEGIPLFIIEYAIGQRMRKSAVNCWKNVHPSLTGVGVSCVIVSFMLCIYYVVVIAWCLYYMFLSFTSTLPWRKADCPQWNSYSKILNNFTAYEKLNKTGVVTLQLQAEMDAFPSCCVRDTPAYYFYEKALKVSTGIGDTGSGVNGPLVGCLALAWVITYVCIVKGVKSSGKVNISFLFKIFIPGRPIRSSTFQSSLHEECLSYWNESKFG